ncbi:hypothetical protein [Rhodococcus sp. SORGH_AS_0303]|uniref:hypothetical protein n=1 Tax=Rhodococcus sp. SORGH_AS_0303 TaxID=3041753 RepID=UPI00278A0E19|nr:hypothetical protein [Rhodococcus sp. SORGH_AS_0303]MDQ1201093.1 hypothetical protein [Rhodococcus sp. SORGH_AS_0303]
MAINVTFTDGRYTEYDDRTWWDVTDGGVLRIGGQQGVPDVLISPSAWSTIDIAR